MDMHRHIALVGSATTHGGKIITGSAMDTIDGRAIARRGDLVDCPLHGVNPIIEGDPATLLDGRPVALEGHRAQCGCRLLAGDGGLIEVGGRP
jgi:uncharacterized Zn-binding protein involved in type VI secretion